MCELINRVDNKVESRDESTKKVRGEIKLWVAKKNGGIGGARTRDLRRDRPAL